MSKPSLSKLKSSVLWFESRRHALLTIETKLFADSHAPITYEERLQLREALLEYRVGVDGLKKQIAELEAQLEPRHSRIRSLIKK